MALTQEQFDELRKRGLTASQISRFSRGEKPDTRSGIKKTADFVTQSEQRFGETLGESAIAGEGLAGSTLRGVLNIPSLGGASRGKKELESAQQGQEELDDANVKLGKAIIKNRKEGKDSSRLEAQYERNTGNRFDISEVAPSINKSAKQIFGEGLGVATDILGAGSLQRKGAGIVGKATSFGSGVSRGVKEGLKGGALFGGADSAFRAMQDDADLMDIAKSGLSGALIGGVSGGAVGGALGGLGGTLSARQIRRADLERAITKGELGGVKFKTANTGKIEPSFVKDKVAMKAIDAGFEPRQINMIKNSSIGDRKLFKEMIDIAEKASDDLGVVDRPIDVTGKSILERIKFLTNKKKATGKALDKAIQELPDRPVDLNNIYTDFVDDLTSTDVRIKANGTLDFRNSIWKNSKASQKVLTDIFSDIRPNTAGDVLRTPQRLVTIRRRMFEDLNLGKTAGDITDTLGGLVNRTRKNMLNTLSDLSDDFSKANTDYARITANEKKFNQLMGKDFNLDSDLANIKAGEISRRLMGNAKFKPYSIMKEIEDLAVDLGYSKGDDIIKQAQFAQLLEDLYDLTPQTSLQGQVSRGVDNAVDGLSLVDDIAKKNILGIFSKGFKKLKGITPEKQRALLKELINNL